MGPGDLTRVLAPIPAMSDPRLLVGRESFDDAGVFLISEDFALVQTVDFFAPIVDDPFAFGEIAAANALSDVYAMGGVPLTAMNIVGFPTSTLPLEVLTEILAGGQSVVHAAGALIVGGHTIIDEELKYGLSVTGRAHPARLLTNSAARPGDRLVLTKALGTGILATAAKRSMITPEQERTLLESMRKLNAVASAVALELQIRCATDITGFGLAGHASHISRGSRVTLRIDRARLPVLPGVWDALAAGIRTGGAERNSSYLEPLVEWGNSSEEERALVVDPQTSGGLLLAIPPATVAEYLSRVNDATEIGEVIEQVDGIAVSIA
jgi:selenide, water dikinase